MSTTVKNITESKKQPTPTQSKMWAWVRRAWETCPTNMTLEDWYQKYREPLYDMYTAAAPDEIEAL